MNRAIKLLNDRQAVKAYNASQIAPKDWAQVLEMIQWSPTSFGLEPYRVLVIDRHNGELLAQIRKTTWGQGIITECDKLVLFISLRRKVVFDLKWIRERYGEITANVLKNLDKPAQQKTVESMSNIIYDNMRNNEHPGDQYAMKQAYIGLGAALIGASLLGIGSTPMEGFDRAALEKLLSENSLIDTDHERVAVLCAFGYPASATAYAHYGSGNRVRVPFEAKFTIL